MLRRNVDILLALAVALMTPVVVLLLADAVAVRVALGVPFVLVVPGYTLVAALYPRKGDLTAVERAALSLSLSVAVVSLLGLALNYTPWGIRLQPILAALSLFTFVVALAALFRRQRSSPEEVFTIAANLNLARWWRTGAMTWLFRGALAVGLLAFIAALYATATSRSPGQTFSEFYLLTAEGKAEGYPTRVVAGQDVTLLLGVVNREGSDVTYRIEARIGDEVVAGLPTIALADGQKWEELVRLSPQAVGERQKVEFLLYKGSDARPYRQLHLWLSVEAPSPAMSTASGSSGQQ